MILDIDFDTGNINRFLHGLTGAMNDLRPAWKVIHQDFMEIEKAQFESEGARSGEKWAPLNLDYAKRKKPPGMPILVRTGVLKSSLTQIGSDHRFVSKPHEMTVGSGVPYGVFHQTGSRDRTRLLARPPIHITQDDKEKWVGVVSDYIRRYLSGH